MFRRTRVLVIAGAGVLALGVFAWRHPGFLKRGQERSRAAALEAAVADVEAGRRSTPLIAEPAAGGEVPVTFVARGTGGRVPRIVSDVTGWGEHTDGTFDFTAGTMTRVGRTDWYSLEVNVALRARIEYLIAYGTAEYGVDPHNPRQAAGPAYGGARASEFVTPGYQPPRAFADPPSSPAGLMVEATVESRQLGEPCRLIVYTPPGYQSDGHYPVAVFLDLRAGPVVRALDWLITRQSIEPILAVFVGPPSPGRAHFAEASLRPFLADELPAWLAARYGVSDDPRSRAIVGISYGAKDALGAALGEWTPPGGFGRLGLLIPGRRIGRADIAAIAEGRGHRLRIGIVAGRYDHANLPTARSLHQALGDAGHDVHFIEVPEGHSSVTWVTHVGDLLVSLYGSAPANAPPGQTRP